jgi:hypothetical protein
MIELELAAAIRLLKPDAEFSFTDGNYSTIKWDVLNGNAPTQAEIDAAIIQVKKNQAAAIAKTETDKAALLTKLGITADEAKLLLG